MHAGVLKIGLAALANLAAAPSNADLIGEEDGVEMTVEAVYVALESASVRLEAPDLEMLMHAAEVLRNLACSATNHAVVPHVDAVRPCGISPSTAVRTHCGWTHKVHKFAFFSPRL